MPRDYRPRPGGYVERAALADTQARLASIVRIGGAALDGDPGPQERRIWIGVRAAARIAQISLDRSDAEAALDQLLNIERLILVGLDLGLGASSRRALQLVELDAGEVVDRLRVIAAIRKD